MAEISEKLKCQQQGGRVATDRQRSRLVEAHHAQLPADVDARRADAEDVSLLQAVLGKHGTCRPERRSTLMSRWPRHRGACTRRWRRQWRRQQTDGHRRGKGRRYDNGDEVARAQDDLSELDVEGDEADRAVREAAQRYHGEDRDELEAVLVEAEGRRLRKQHRSQHGPFRSREACAQR